MIAKLESINYGLNALIYCEKGGELLATKKCLGSPRQIYNQMKQQEKFNDRCTNKTFHIKLRAAPEDKGKLTNQDWIAIAQKYALKIGFQDNMYALYMHEEGTEREHIHIVSSRIKDNNLAVPDSFTHFKSLDFSRVIEREYGLRQVKRKLESVKLNQEFVPNNQYSKDLKSAILAAIDVSDTMDDVVFHLKNKNIQTKIGRGITFVDCNGIIKKGSKIDRTLSLQGIIKRLEYNNQEKAFKNRRGPGI